MGAGWEDGQQKGNIRLVTVICVLGGIKGRKV